MPHPFGPVAAHYATGFGPAAGRVVRFVPFQRPQFLKSNLSGGPIQESAIYIPVVPINAGTPHMLHALPCQIL